jgi:hypothetical protein
VLRQGSGPSGERAVAIVTRDAVGFDGRAFVEQVRALIYEQAGIPGANVLLAATHA